MLKRFNRVRNTKEYSYIYKKGKGFSCDIFTLVVCQSDTFKVGFSINKKVGKAFMRNKIKRTLSEIIRLKINDLKNCRMILVVRPSIVDKSYNDIKISLENLLYKANIYK